MRLTLASAFALGIMLVAGLLLAGCGSSATATPPVPPNVPTAAVTATVVSTPILTATATAQAFGPAQELAVDWEKNAKLGDILVDNKGRTVYTYKDDKPGQSACTGDCAKTWPPVVIDKGFQPVAGPELPGKASLIQRPDGTPQVAYNDMPLYLYSKDGKPGEANGQGLQNLWYVVPVTPALAATPAQAAATSAAPAATPAP